MTGTKEFYELMTQFERDLPKMPFYLGAKPVRSAKGSQHSFYENGQINNLFQAYMHGYQNAKAMARLGEFD